MIHFKYVQTTCHHIISCPTISTATLAEPQHSRVWLTNSAPDLTCPNNLSYVCVYIYVAYIYPMCIIIYRYIPLFWWFNPLLNHYNHQPTCPKWCLIRLPLALCRHRHLLRSPRRRPCVVAAAPAAAGAAGGETAGRASPGGRRSSAASNLEMGIFTLW